MSTKAKGSSIETLKQMNRRHAREFKQEIESGHYDHLEEQKTMSTSTETQEWSLSVDRLTIFEYRNEQYVPILRSSYEDWQKSDLTKTWPTREEAQIKISAIVTEHNGFQLLANRLESQASTLARITGERDELRAALQLIQGFNWQLDDSAHGQEIKRRALLALNPTSEREGGAQ